MHNVAVLAVPDAHRALDGRQAHVQLSATVAGIQHQLWRRRREGRRPHTVAGAGRLAVAAAPYGVQLASHPADMQMQAGAPALACTPRAPASATWRPPPACSPAPPAGLRAAAHPCHAAASCRCTCRKGSGGPNPLSGPALVSWLPQLLHARCAMLWQPDMAQAAERPQHPAPRAQHPAELACTRRTARRNSPTAGPSAAGRPPECSTAGAARPPRPPTSAPAPPPPPRALQGMMRRARGGSRLSS